ncbi:MAG TPA: hypothetical protein VHE54_01400, partial [Puia sp.]|nr:hypothetical protein [Puia sp.]
MKYQGIFFSRIKIFRFVQYPLTGVTVGQSPRNKLSSQPVAGTFRMYVSNPVECFEIRGPEIIRRFIRPLPSHQVYTSIRSLYRGYGGIISVKFPGAFKHASLTAEEH